MCYVTMAKRTWREREKNRKAHGICVQFMVVHQLFM